MVPFLTRQRPRAPSSADERFDVLHKAAEIERDLLRPVSRMCRLTFQSSFWPLASLFGRPNPRLTSSTRSVSENTSPAGRGRRALARRVRVTRPDVSRSRSLTLRTSRSCEAKLAEGDRLNTENVRQHSRPRVPPRTPPEPSVRLPDFRGRQRPRIEANLIDGPTVVERGPP